MFIHSIATSVPETSYPQQTIGEIMLRGMDPASKPARLLKRIYAHSDIDKRHSVIKDYALAEEGLFLDSDLRSLKNPTTCQRNERYTREARAMFTEVGSRAVEEAPGVDRNDIPHVITASCTGFFAPGPDFYVVHDMGLSTSVQRAHIGFMGCYAAFPALRLARSITMADPEAVVLVICVELCTLHIQPTEEIDKIIATSVFADGAGAAVVSAREPSQKGRSLRMDSFSTSISPDSQDDMAWKIGDHGFDMVLSTYVPRILEANVPDIVDSLLSDSEYSRKDIHHWAIHPGGKAILDKVAKSLELPPEALDGPRTVLRNYGNMSSATILFVLKELLASQPNESDLVFALAFGPGLTVESAILSVV